VKYSARGRSDLDGMIVEIELTLVSIIQGVALAVLIESAKGIITQRHALLWPYVLAGLFIILVFWSRAVLHIITVIRWPLEFGHNFLYIGCALIEAISFAQLARPENWFAFGAVFIAVGWLLFVYDLRLIHARQRDSAGEASDKLLAFVLRDQWLNIGVLLPIVFLLNIGCALAIHLRPQFFLEHNGHLWLVAAQLIGFAGYLIYVIRFYGALAPLIEHAREEWHREQSD
jgi:hypothetical protein